MKNKMNISGPEFEQFVRKNNLVMKKGGFYKTTNISDRGFRKWYEAADTTFKVIKWIGLIW